MFAERGAAARLHLPQQHVIAPEAGEVPQHLPRLLLLQQAPGMGAVLQDQPPVAGKVDIHQAFRMTLREAPIM